MYNVCAYLNYKKAEFYCKQHITIVSKISAMNFSDIENLWRLLFHAILPYVHVSHSNLHDRLKSVCCKLFVMK